VEVEFLSALVDSAFLSRFLLEYSELEEVSMREFRLTLRGWYSRE
jgi:hypothetical protein